MVTNILHHTEHPGAIALPITTEQRQVAQHFVDQYIAQQPFLGDMAQEEMAQEEMAQKEMAQEKTAQIERNTLAVCAVNAYLQMMGVETDIAASDSWNPMMQGVSDVADLIVPGVGTLACRAMAPGEDVCYVPPEAWIDRAGYVAVVIDTAEHQATLLGFMPSVGEEEKVAIAQFAPIETLLDHIYTLKTAAENALETAPLAERVQATVTQMSQWFEGMVTSGWQSVDELLNPPQAGFAFRSVNTARTPDASRAKAIALEDASIGQSIQIALIVQISQVSEDSVDIILQVRPLGNELRLPEGISLSIFDDGNNLVRSATSRAIDNYIQLQVVGEPEESFSIQIRMGDACFEEYFQI